MLWHDRCHQYLHQKEEREVVDPMNVDTLIESVLFLTGTTLWVSVAIRGMQRAPLANAAERDQIGRAHV